MAISLKHAFTSGKADGPDSTLVQPSNWNAEHTLTLATNRLVGRTTAGTGAAEEISVGTGLSLSATTLSLDAELVALAGLVSAADRLPYFTGSGTAALATFTTAARNLLDDADAATMRTTLGLGSASVTDAASTTEVLTGTATNRAVTPDALAALWEQGANIASATTITVGEGGYFAVTGTTTITDIDLGTDKAGREFALRFDGALTLTHGAALILPGAANITTAAGDVAIFRSEGTDVVRCISYSRASGAPVVGAGGMTFLGTISTASGSSANLGSLNLTNYKFLVLVLKAVSISSAATNLMLGNSTSDDIAIGDLSGFTSGYLHGHVWIDLESGTFASTLNSTTATSNESATSNYGRSGDGPITTATTTITVAPNTGTLDNGSIRVYGVS